MGNAVGLVKETFRQWREDKVSRLAASLAYFTIFSMAPLFIIVIAIAGVAFGREAATGQIVEQLRGMVGAAGAEAIEEVIKNADQPARGRFAALTSIVMLIVGASGVFVALQDALNTVWGIQARGGLGWKGFVRKRILSFTLVVTIGFLLLVSLVISAALAGVNGWLTDRFPGAGFVIQVLNMVLSFGVITVMFALMFQYLPDVRVRWRHVWVGAIATAILFSVGKYFIGLYLGNSSVASVYGAAGSLVVLLIWIFYSAQILLLGAEFTQVYATAQGDEIATEAHAVAVTEEARAREGNATERRVEEACEESGKDGGRSGPSGRSGKQTVDGSE